MKSDTKKFLFSIVVVLIIILSGYLIKGYLDNSSKRLLTQISNLEVWINNDEWEKAREAALRLNKDWEDTESIWTIFTNHHEIDNISITLKNSIEYIKSGDKTDSLASLASLKHYISHIPEIESIVIKNIF